METPEAPQYRPTGSVLYGGLAASAAAPVLYIGWTSIAQLRHTASAFGRYDTSQNLASEFAVLFFIAALHVLILGLPFYVWLARRGLVRWWSLTAAGFVAGAVPLGGLMCLLGGRMNLSGALQFGAMMGGLGAASAFAGWAVGRLTGSRGVAESSRY